MFKCTGCGRYFFEDLPQCPHCKTFVNFAARPVKRHRWIWLTAIICLRLILLWFFQLSR
jgi:hypothetical protein